MQYFNIAQNMDRIQIMGIAKSLKPRILKDKKMADKLMYIPNNDTQNYPYCRLKLVVETIGHST